MEKFGLDFIKQNNQRIRASFTSHQPRYVPPAETKEDKGAVNEDERRFLAAVEMGQYKIYLSEVYKNVSFSGYKGNKVARYLESNGYIKLIEIIKGKGVSKFPILLGPAYEILNLPEKKFYGKGAGYEHVIWQHLIAEHFLDYKPIIESNKNNKFIDVAVKQNDRLIGIEIAMTSVNEKVNVIKDIQQAGVDFVIVGCKDQKVLGEVKGMVSSLDEYLKQKVAVYLLSEVIKKNLEELLNRK